MKHLTRIFFGVACAVNLAGRIWNPALASAVKPALMPLLAVCVLTYALSHKVDKRTLSLLISAELFGCAGDIFLLSSDFIFFAGGIVMFLIGHIFYITNFGGRSWKGLGWKVWLPAAAVMAATVAVLIVLLQVRGALMPAMAVYGSALMLLVFSTLCGLVRFADKGAWAILFCGAVLFTFSDALIAAETFGVADFALSGFVVMLTYLAAQTLLAIGTIRLAAGTRNLV